MIKLFRVYGFFGSLRLIQSVLYTRFFFPQAKIIRLPFDIRNKKYIGIGHGFITGFGCRIEAYPLIATTEPIIKIGSNVQMNDYVHITAMESVTIGNNVLMASKIYISDCSHGSYEGTELDSSPLEIPILRKYKTKAIYIEDNVWLGEFVSILPGVTIGKGTIVGANSVVTKSLPPNVIAVGAPAKPIKQFNFDTERWEIIK